MAKRLVLEWYICLGFGMVSLSQYMGIIETLVMPNSTNKSKNNSLFLQLP
jgi:hypothetical protein